MRRLPPYELQGRSNCKAAEAHPLYVVPPAVAAESRCIAAQKRHVGPCRPGCFALSGACSFRDDRAPWLARSGIQVGKSARRDDQTSSSALAPKAGPAAKARTAVALASIIAAQKSLSQSLLYISAFKANRQVLHCDMALACVPAAQQLHRPSLASRLSGSRAMATLPRQRCTVAVAAAAGPPIMVNSCTGKVSTVA